MRSQAAAERSSAPERVGGTNKAPALRVGVNMLARRRPSGLASSARASFPAFNVG